MIKTVAILGDTGNFFAELVKALMKQDLRLLFVSEDEEHDLNIINNLEQTEAVAEVEFTGCEHDGCWEADIILINQPQNISCSLIERIKEVATQKVVLLVSGNKLQFEELDFKKLLPHSKVVEVFVDLQKMEFSVSGKDPEAIAGVEAIFANACFEIQRCL
ncbi:hypothetical protein RM549_09335 [Salegentibacter sp. F188]|uniref:Uncharacterized protein n=1 Tax=Autumnicola patrickiae TaxID=3075591 RepID=A0ABU3E219_9FLAO|nr:hypothetical protein [Salegentibacter sp. F188]MDT0689985.1 hypothetical protein [Salegentibacter sp. F188]